MVKADIAGPPHVLDCELADQSVNHVTTVCKWTQMQDGVHWTVSLRTNTIECWNAQGKTEKTIWQSLNTQLSVSGPAREVSAYYSGVSIHTAQNQDWGRFCLTVLCHDETEGTREGHYSSQESLAEETLPPTEENDIPPLHKRHKLSSVEDYRVGAVTPVEGKLLCVLAVPGLVDWFWALPLEWLHLITTWYIRSQDGGR
ncbi:hypothetical protein JOB18_013894 [Solea senegalensis]|uniref:Uncharacterized protein n=1 Tax=Solea senegalensis TaxID=28829 RepID=A0AAV6S7X4_SOLSE|nr:hypothetical protein JOB18_013894 [Solea senegalensis]